MWSLVDESTAALMVRVYRYIVYMYVICTYPYTHIYNIEHRGAHGPRLQEPAGGQVVTRGTPCGHAPASGAGAHARVELQSSLKGCFGLIRDREQLEQD